MSPPKFSISKIYLTFLGGQSSRNFDGSFSDNRWNQNFESHLIADVTYVTPKSHGISGSWNLTKNIRTNSHSPSPVCASLLVQYLPSWFLAMYSAKLTCTLFTVVSSSYCTISCYYLVQQHGPITKCQSYKLVVHVWPTPHEVSQNQPLHLTTLYVLTLWIDLVTPC